MKNEKPIIAIMYDFDKTLCPKDMQEYTFIPNLGMSADEFWKESNYHASTEKMDRILTCMYMMIDKSNTNHKSIRREDFVILGKDIEFFKGVEKWFSHINEYGEKLGVIIEHYIISSGLKEIIEGTSIYKEFERVYASEFYYNHNGIATWPKLAVNYTTKTQFLFRINKGIFDISNDLDLNRVIPKSERRTPFTNMIYIGDGLTDVPCMKLVKSRGGKSIAVHQPHTKKNVTPLLVDNRVDFMVNADYSKGEELYNIVTTTIKNMAAANELSRIYEKHQRELNVKW